MPFRLNFVTGNAGKFAEVAEYLSAERPDIQLLQTAVDLLEIQSREHADIALFKAKQAYEQLQEPVLIDDSGVYFEKYDKFPGTLARSVYQGLGLVGLQRLYDPGDRAYMQTYFIYYAGPHDYYIAQGTTHGTLIAPDEPGIHPAFPYNCIFIPDGSTESIAALERQGRARDFNNHRVAALQQLLARLKV